MPRVPGLRLAVAEYHKPQREMVAMNITERERALSTAEIQRWLFNYAASLAAGVNVGQIKADKAHRMRLELIRRGDVGNDHR